MKKLLGFVYDTWYGAAAVLLGVYALQGCYNFLLAHFKYAMPEWSGHLELGLAALVIVCMLNCLVAVIVSCVRRKWGRFFGQIGAGALMFIISLVASLLILIHGMFGPSEDHFNDGLTIPVGLECAEPEDQSEVCRSRKYADDEGFALALADPKDYKGVQKKVRALYEEIFRTKRNLALAYFRKNELWTVIGICERGMDITGFRLERTYWAGTQYVTVKFTAQEPFRDSYFAKEGCQNPEAGYYAAMTELYAELQKVAELKDAGEIDAALPKPKKYVPDVKPDFKLINGSQGGIYGYLATVDPGEDGEVYLQAFEVTKGTPLSSRRIKQCTVERVSGKDNQVIGSGKEFTIYEGDWDHYYAARIEIWFVPASGGRERKLKEKVFKVQGWMR